VRIGEILNSHRPVFSVEFFPSKTDEGKLGLLETARQLAEFELDFVSVTYGAGGSTREGTVDITRTLKEEIGLEVMAHLSCVGETREGIAETLDRLQSLGIDNIFALRGDPPRGEQTFVQPEGGFGSAAELTAFVRAEYDFAIGGACFPEVHPEAPDLDTDLDYLKTKVDAGAEFLITQLFFDNRVYSSIPTELEAAMLAAEGDPEAEFNLGVAYAAQQSAELLAAGAPGIHFYALNKAPATRGVLGALRAARPWLAPHAKAWTGVRNPVP
jgi:methylenetetrahydrofolate reductase (NADPH)